MGCGLSTYSKKARGAMPMRDEGTPDYAKSASHPGAYVGAPTIGGGGGTVGYGGGFVAGATSGDKTGGTVRS